MLLGRPATRNAAGKGKVFRVIEVLRNVNVAEYGQIQFGVLATNVLPIEGYTSLNNADVWFFGYQENSDVSDFPTCFPRVANDPSIVDRYFADIICPSHLTHDPDCGICQLAQSTQVTPLSRSTNHGAEGISKMLAESGKVFVLTSRPTVSPAGGIANDFGKSPPEPLASATWSRKFKAHYVSAEGQHISTDPLPTQRGKHGHQHQ